MGDRVFTRIRVSGKLPLDKKAEFEALLEAEGLLPEGEDDPFTYYDDECNYANLDEFTQWLFDNGLYWFQQWEAGGGFAAGIHLYDYTGYHYQFGWGDEGVLFSVEDLQLAKLDDISLGAIVEKMEHINSWREKAPPLEFV